MDQRHEMVEDYALRFVPRHFRKSWLTIFNAASGGTTALFILTYAGGLALTYGSEVALGALLFSVLFVGTVGYILSKFAIDSGLDCDLMTRGSGYGFLGSAITSLIYSGDYIMFFAIEGNIMAAPVHAFFPFWPVWLIDLVIGILFVPLAWWGITLIDKVEGLTIPIYAIGMAVLIYFAWLHLPNWSWLTYSPQTIHYNPKAGPPLLQAIATAFAGLSIATQSGDLSRFIRKEDRQMGAWALGPLTIFLSKIMFGTLGIYFAMAFATPNPGLPATKYLGLFGVFFAIITQLRINTLNAYFGSLAFSNFFARVFKLAPGRQWWVVLTAALGTILMELNVLSHLNYVLTFFGVFMVAWVSSITTDMVVNRALGLRPNNFEYKRSHLYAFNPVGMVTLVVALVVGGIFISGVVGPLGFTLAPYVSALIGMGLPILMAFWTKGKYYLHATKAAYEEQLAEHLGMEETLCPQCQEQFENEDFVFCPFTARALCSVCCAVTKHCGEVCKEQALATPIAFAQKEMSS